MRVILFFSYGVSLRDWKNSGLFDREVKIYRNLANNKNLKITFITYGDEEDLQYENEIPEIQIIPLFMYYKKFNNNLIQILNSLLIGFKLRNLIKDENVIVKTNQLWGSWVAIIFKITTRSSLIVRTGYDLLSFKVKENKSRIKISLYYLLTQFGLIFCNYYFVSSNTDKRYLMNKKFFFKNKIQLVPNWVDVNKFDYQTKRSGIIAIGRLEKQKNFEYLIKSFQNTNKEITLIGDGSLRNKLVRLSEKLNCKVNFLGKINNNEVLNLISKHKYYVLTSLYEGNPKSLLEAMSLGCVVIAPKDENITEIIKDGVNGFIYQPDLDNINNLIDELERKDLTDIRKKAFEYVVENNSLEIISNKEFATYTQILS
ncbi:MAG: hypothetical protein CMA27_03385 [Euryarchaeota archaeon]|nr:hypothetical protein [Euryarchaeota archaeon]